MKVYVVHFQEQINGVFSTKEKAIEHLAKAEWVKLHLSSLMKNYQFETTIEEFAETVIEEYIIDAL